MLLEGKIALVTGASRGIGRQIALTLAKEGAVVIVNYNGSAAKAEEVVKEITEAGGTAEAVQCSVSDYAKTEEMMKDLIARYKRIDILVNNAALQYNLDFSGYDAAKIRTIFQVNLGGYLRMSQRVLSPMRQKGWGRIIHISSVHAKRPTTFDFCYSMTKGAIKMLTRELALECGGTGITVNSLELGAVEIGVKSGNPQSAITGEQAGLNPLLPYRPERPWGRIIQPEQVAPAVMFLASEGADCINGAALRLDDAAMLL